jgi:hypothetical protein
MKIYDELQELIDRLRKAGVEYAICGGHIQKLRGQA